MLQKNKISIFAGALLFSLLLAGCVHNVPLTVDPNKDMSRAFPRTKKIPAKVGIFISDDLKKYVYKQQKMGMTFQMNVGGYLPRIGLEMAMTMFDDVIPVDSLPPYIENYRPDVEAVIKPEILYCYGNAVGALRGYIEGRAIIRITAYDLSGKVLWQGEAMGTSRSKEMSFVGTLADGMGEVGKIGYQSAFTAAARIIDEFNARPPKELHSLLEIKSVGTLKNRRNIANYEIFQNYYQKGQYQYEKKNYYQALYSFEKADNFNPEDLSTLFYVGVCYTYTGAKDKALEKFRKIVDLGPRSQEATDAKKWLDLLRKPLKIAIVHSRTASDRGLDDGLISKALQNSRMYELLDVNDLRPPTATNPQKKWNLFLNRCLKKGVRIVLISEVDNLSQKLRVSEQPIGDVATEHVVKISSKAYSAKMKEVKADINISEMTSTISEQSREEEGAIKRQLLKNAADKLVLRLLENDIY